MNIDTNTQSNDIIITNLISKDPFAEESSENGISQNELIHIRIQQRNGKKSLTTIQGLSTEYNLKKISKSFKKEFACNGCIINHPEFGEIIQLQGDQRDNIKEYLINSNMANDDLIKVHGF